jgi:3-deoxy-D-manno-octulosonate 8-phosphate phosphatase (KDO 8-P phosphatase)
VSPRRPTGATGRPTAPARIRLLVLDVDGVITDGGLLFDSTGQEWKRFHVHDGLALVAARRAGLQVAVVSSRASPAVARRMAELGVDEVHQGIGDKAPVVRAIIGRLGLSTADVAAMGDDLPDLPVMEMVGLRLAPANAVAEVRRAAHWVSRRTGGQGAVREAIEMLLRARHAWPPPSRTPRPPAGSALTC